MLSHALFQPWFDLSLPGLPSCTALSIIGGVFEVIGFGVVGWELARVQRRELGAPRSWKRLKAWFRRHFGESRTVRASAGIASTVDMAARLSIRKGGGNTVELRLSALEENLKRLEEETSERDADLEAQISKLRTELQQLRDRLDQERAQAEEERREALRSSIAFQATGTALFVIGTVLSVIANTC